MKKILLYILVAIVLYAISYVIFRASHVEVWEEDKKEYVIFPKDNVWTYYLYRPATYVDSKVSDMRFHIGPHQANQD